MKKYVSLNKRSKKAQREYYSEQRRTWGELNPVTKSMPSGKTYNRNKCRQEMKRISRESDGGYGAGPFYLSKKRNNVLNNRPDYVIMLSESENIGSV